MQTVGLIARTPGGNVDSDKEEKHLDSLVQQLFGTTIPLDQGLIFWERSTILASLGFISTKNSEV